MRATVMCSLKKTVLSTTRDALSLAKGGMRTAIKCTRIVLMKRWYAYYNKTCPQHLVRRAVKVVVCFQLDRFRTAELPGRFLSGVKTLDF